MLHRKIDPTEKMSLDPRDTTCRMFEKIDILSLDGLSTGWHVSLEELSSFVKYAYERNGFFSDSSRARWATRFYCDSSLKGLSRLEGFRQTAMSIRENGYITPLEYNYEFGGDDYILVNGMKMVLTGALPRILLGNPNLIDDGRHRLAALSALRVKTTPVIIIKIINSSELGMQTFRVDVIQGIEKFKRSHEWQRYMETDDFKKSKLGGGAS